MIVHEVKQGTAEWLALRAGKFTASNFATLFMGKSTKGYNDLINTVVYERLTGNVPESYENEWMKRGKELEPAARLKYELETFDKVTEVGFVEQDEWVGCSPDGLVGEDGMIQIKCPKYNTFINYCLNNNLPVNEYSYQVQGEMMVTGRRWSDLFIYNETMKPLVLRIQRDEEIIARIKAELKTAINLAQERIKTIKEKI